MLKPLVLTVAATLFASTAAAAATPEQQMMAAANKVSEARLRADVSKLVSFGTRHTLSSQTDPKRGIGASVRWAEAELKALGLETLQTCDTVMGRRVPQPTKVCNAVGIQRGTERPNDVVIITGHIDSRVTDVMNATSDAPGANDDGSGTTAVLEAARALRGGKFGGTIVYGVLSGEEQGLLGGKILSDYAKTRGWNVVANLNNDIIGNSCGSDGVCDNKTVRVFSEGPRWQGREALAAAQRSLGGENGSPSRNISRFLDRLAERLPQIGLDVRQVWRNDRFGRGGDHTEFLNAGFPAVRFSVAVENYNQQHQDLRTEKGVEYGDTIDKMDLPYLAKVVRLNVAALMAIANAPPPPAPVAEGAVSTDTTVSWMPLSGASAYKVHWRRTDENLWTKSSSQVADVIKSSETPIPGSPTSPNRPSNNASMGRVPDGAQKQSVLKGVRVDDWVFGVSSISKEGWESPIASAVPGGAFKPYVAPVSPAAQ